MLRCQHKICWFYERQGWAVTDEASEREREREQKVQQENCSEETTLYQLLILANIWWCLQLCSGPVGFCCIATDFPLPISAKPCSISCDLTHHTTLCFLSCSPVFVSQLQKGGQELPPGCMFQYLQLSHMHSRRCLQNQTRSLHGANTVHSFRLVQDRNNHHPLDLSGSLHQCKYYSSSSPLGFCHFQSPVISTHLSHSFS